MSVSMSPSAEMSGTSVLRQASRIVRSPQARIASRTTMRAPAVRSRLCMVMCRSPGRPRVATCLWIAARSPEMNTIVPGIHPHVVTWSHPSLKSSRVRSPCRYSEVRRARAAHGCVESMVH